MNWDDLYVLVVLDCEGLLVGVVWVFGVNYVMVLWCIFMLEQSLGQMLVWCFVWFIFLIEMGKQVVVIVWDMELGVQCIECFFYVVQGMLSGCVWLIVLFVLVSEVIIFVLCFFCVDYFDLQIVLFVNVQIVLFDSGQVDLVVRMVQLQGRQNIVWCIGVVEFVLYVMFDIVKLLSQ